MWPAPATIARRAAGNSVGNSGAAVQDNPQDQLGDIADCHMISSFLSLPEQNQFFALGGKTSKAIWAVTVMRIVDAIGRKLVVGGQPFENSGPLEQEVRIFRSMPLCGTP